MRRLLIVLLALGAAVNAAAAQERPSPPVSKDGSAAPASPAAETAGAGAIKGRVVEEGGQPLSDVGVLLLPAGRAGADQMANFARTRWTFTDVTGSFSLEALDAGLYKLIINYPGYVQTSGDEASAGQPVYYRPGDSPSLTMFKGGVIAGKVTNELGGPVVGVRVRARVVRDPYGKAVRNESTDLATQLMMLDWRTDDTGAYRIWGLPPGVYVVCAGGASTSLVAAPTDYDGDAPTCHPSAASPAGAREVTVQKNEESRGVDIRYRGSQGYSVSGLVSGVDSPALVKAVVVTLTETRSGSDYAMAAVISSDGAARFSLSGVADGEYEIAAVGGLESQNISVSSPRRISVKGADVTDVRLELSALGSASGKVVLERLPDADPREGCRQTAASVPEVLLHAWLDERGRDKLESGVKLPALGPLIGGPEGAPGPAGEFSIKWLRRGHYRLGATLPDGLLYLRRVSLPGATPKTPLDVGRDGFSLAQGGQVEGLEVGLAEGAASVSGRVIPARAGRPLPEPLRVHLIPAEEKAADEVLRYFETAVGGDGSFTLDNLAPGLYWLLAAPPPKEQGEGPARRPLAWDADSRRKLRGRVGAGAKTLDLKPCRQVEDYSLKYEERGARP